MSYQVLARKYRPQTFEEVVGQQPIVTTLQNAVAQKRLHHAYLFSGLRGVGKTTVARLMAKALNCAEGPTATPCNRCASCREIAESRALDVLEIDGASNRGIDAVRELRETVRYSPSRDRYKVYIIDEVHMLTSEAWNALLKTLEEPPPHVVFLFATTDPRKIPLTILSRCQHFEFRKIAHADMERHLRKVAAGEAVTVPDGALDLIVRTAAGSLRDAQSALDQVIAFSGDAVTEEQARTILGVIDRELVTGFFTAVRAGDCARLLEIIESVFDQGYQPSQFLEDLMAHGRDLLLARAVKEPARFLPGGPEEVAAIARQAAPFTEDELLRLLELLTREEQRVKNSAHPRYLLEALAIKLARLADLTPIEDLLAGERPATAGGRAPEPAARRSAPAGSAPPPAAPGPPVSPAPSAAPPPSGSAGSAALPASGTPSGTGDPAVIEAILKRVQEARGSLGGFLAHAAWVDLADGALVIAFDPKQSFFKEKVEGRENLEVIREAARRIAGADLKVKVVSAGARPVATAPSPAPSRPAAVPRDPGVAVSATPPALVPAPAGGRMDEGLRQRLETDARNEPLVRNLLETFDGQIVDIESA